MSGQLERLTEDVTALKALYSSFLVGRFVRVLHPEDFVGRVVRKSFEDGKDVTVSVVSGGEDDFGREVDVALSDIGGILS